MSAIYQRPGPSDCSGVLLPATAAAAATATAGPLGSFAGLVDREGASAKLCTVKSVDRGLGRGIIRHLDESKATGPARLAIHGNVHI